MSQKTLSIEVKDLTVKFGDFTAVDRLTLSVEKGEIFGFLGANGAGKTTTIRVLCGLLLPSEGEVTVAGLHWRDGGNRIKSRVGYMSQKFTLYEDLSVGENIDFKGAIQKMDPREVRRKRDELFEFIGFEYSLSSRVKEIPSGVRQKLSLAATLLHDPEIIVLDEPTAGVSPAVRGKFWALIEALSEKKKTLLVTTHYMDEANRCDRIALMRRGKLIAMDTPEVLKRETYPRGMLEVSPLSPEKISPLRQQIRESRFVESHSPFGSRFHVVLKEFAGEKDFIEELRPWAEIRQIDPSLEDVFIRRVEGEDR